VSVLPPARPNLEGRTAAAEATARTASLPPADAKPAAKPKPAVTPTPSPKPEAAAEKPAAGAKTFAVQIAVRPSEQEARTAWEQAQEKFGSTLENRPARLTNATVNGKTVHRVRLGPMTKAEADAMCGRLKARGSNCFVAPN
jgi:cell division protein FtsN